jgi:beta-N-acetylhexosaminidase
VMTTRVVSGDPDQITRYAKHFLRGLAQHGVLGNGKHFPGLGSGQVDSHHATPLITKPFDLLWQEDMVPYRRLARQLPMVTVSHASYTAADEEPASISQYWINKVLVREIGYKGLILSDDMEMGGILKYTGIAEASVRSLHAGIHGLEICREPALVFAAYEAILREAESSPSFARLLRRAAAKVSAVAASLPKKLPPSPTMAAVQRTRTAVERFTEKIEVAPV